MVWEFPAVSQSRVEFWKEPQFTKSGMWWFTLTFGFFGLHHLYLRSPQTALIFCIANFLTLGFPWFYDLIQLSTAGETLESLNKYGLNTHVYLLGIAQGMWKKDEPLIPSFAVREQAQKSAPAPEPSAPAPVPKPISEFGGNPKSAPASASAPAPEPSAPEPSAPPASPEPFIPKPSEFGGNPKAAPASAPTPEPFVPKPISEFGGNPKAPTSAPAPVPTPISEFGGNPKAPLTSKEKYEKLMAIKPPQQKIREKQLSSVGLSPSWATFGKQKGGGQEGPPNPTWFLLYALLIPIAPLAQLIAGDTNNAVSRFLDLTIVPLGFLFYLCAFIYDYMILLLYPADLFVAGSKRFFPFTYLGMDPEGHSERLTGVSEIKPCPADGFIITMFRISLPLLSYFFPGLGQSVEAALSTAQKTKEIVVDQGLEKINKATRIAKQASDIAATVGSLGPMPGLQVPLSAQTAQRAAMGLPVMVGGAQGFTALDYAALGSLGAVIAGGFVLSLNRSKNDSPPNPRRV
jgi:hypothetical protein